MTTFSRKRDESEWRPGDIVIHAGDPKDTKHLLLMLGYNIKGMAVAEYNNPALNNRRIICDVSELLDPKVFKINYTRREDGVIRFDG
jgi:hypothetical protein